MYPAVADLGAGQNLAGVEAGAQTLRQRGQEIGTQPLYARAAAGIGDSLRLSGGPQRAVDEIETFLLRRAAS